MDYNKVFNDRILTVKPSGIRKYFDIAAQMEDVISLSIGEPDFVTPKHIRDAGIASLNAGKTAYTANFGLLELRQEIAKYLERRFQVAYDPKDEILVTVGGSEAIDIVIRAVIQDGDELLLPEPAFVSYAPLAAVQGGKAVSIVTTAENKFKLMPEDLKKAITPKTKAIVLSYPSNPTGAIMTREEFAAIAEVLKDTNILVIADEIYAELTYGKDHTSFASIPGMRERTVLVSGFSKAFAMTGWRLGYCCAPRELMVYFGRVHQFALMSAPSVAQYAAVEAMKNGMADVKEMREQYNARREYLYNELLGMGFDCFEPEGAFYIFPNVSKFASSSADFCERLLKEKGVAVVPGDAFGDCGEGHVRMSYAASMENIQEAVKRMKEFLGK